MPKHRKKHSKSTIALVAVMALLAVLTLLSAVLSAGIAGAMLSILAATLPALLVALLVLLFDRYDPEPRALLELTFAFGATGAVLIALIGEGVATVALHISSGQLLEAAVIAPVIEEIAKGLAVLVVMLRLKDEFTGIIDGVVYAVMVGSGFAFAENISYYISALLQGQQTFAATVIVRGGFSAFSHPLFTSMTGIGLALAMQRHGKGRIVPPLLGLLGAMLLHGLWNAVNSIGGFLLVYIGVFLPILGVVIVVIWVAARRQGKVLGTYLARDVSTGLLSADEFLEMTSLARRRKVLRSVAKGEGNDARDARRAFQHASAQLAFTRYRSRPNPPDPAAEMRWVREIESYKRSANPAWASPGE